MSKFIGIYHKDCIDGTTSASVLYKKHFISRLIPFSYTYSEEDFQSVLEKVRNDTSVYILDFSLRNEDLKRLLERAKEVIVIDHHKSEYDRLSSFRKEYSNYKYIFDNEKSGASLTWEYLFSEPMPELIKYVEDRDIWRWKYEEKTKYINLYLLTLVNEPEEVLKLFDKPIKEIIEKGRVISYFSSFLIEKLAEEVKGIPIKIGNYVVEGYNVNIFQSEIGSILIDVYDKSVLLFKVLGDRVKFSFRSKKTCKPSALELASILGGGGHEHAAGAVVSLKDFLKMTEEGLKEKEVHNNLHKEKNIEINSNVNPKHYKSKNPEPIDVIVSWDLSFLEGNVIKYLSRWKDKNGIEDLLKAKWYLEKLIEVNSKEGEE